MLRDDEFTRDSISFEFRIDIWNCNGAVLCFELHHYASQYLTTYLTIHNYHLYSPYTVWLICELFRRKLQIIDIKRGYPILKWYRRIICFVQGKAFENCCLCCILVWVRSIKILTYRENRLGARYDCEMDSGNGPSHEINKMPCMCRDEIEWHIYRDVIYKPGPTFCEQFQRHNMLLWTRRVRRTVNPHKALRGRST